MWKHCEGYGFLLGWNPKEAHRTLLWRILRLGYKFTIHVSPIGVSSVTQNYSHHAIMIIYSMLYMKTEAKGAEQIYMGWGWHRLYSRKLKDDVTSYKGWEESKHVWVCCQNPFNLRVWLSSVPQLEKKIIQATRVVFPDV